MKKMMIIILTLLISLSSCMLYDINIDQQVYMYLGDGFDIYRDHGITSKMPHSIARIMSYKIDYKKDSTEKFQSPEETFSKGTGDCEDFSIAYMNVLYTNCGIKSTLIAVDNTTRSIENGGITNHVVVLLPNGIQIDPQNGEVCDFSIKYKYTFDEVFK